jgi:hypothetical protein
MKAEQSMLATFLLGVSCHYEVDGMEEVQETGLVDTQYLVIMTFNGRAAVP